MLGDSIRRRRPARREDGGEAGESPRRPRRRSNQRDGRFTWLHWAGLAVLVVVFSFFAGYILATRVFFPPPATAGVGVPVPSLYGLDRREAEETIRGHGLEVGAVTQVASLRTPPGRVMAQEPLPEQQLRPGAQVSFAVSAGAPEVTIPPVTGLGGVTARRLLEAAGFQVDVQPVRAAGLRDVAVGTDPDAGSSVRLPAVVTLMVNIGPEEPAPADSPAAPPGEPEWP